MPQKIAVFIVSLAAFIAAGKKVLDSGRNLGLWD